MVQIAANIGIKAKPKWINQIIISILSSLVNWNSSSASKKIGCNGQRASDDKSNEHAREDAI